MLKSASGKGDEPATPVRAKFGCALINPTSIEVGKRCVTSWTTDH
ncbi:MAG: hypothetical protein WCH30_08275 [Chlorobiaceae bacterium]